MYVSRKEFDAAFEAIERAVAVDSNDPRNFHQRAYIRYKRAATGQVDEVSQRLELEDYMKTMTMPYERLGIVHNNVAYIYYEMGDITSSFEHFQKSIDFAPYHVRALYDLSFFNQAHPCKDNIFPIIDIIFDIFT